MGKKVPENRNMGRMAKRNMVVSPVSSSSRQVMAVAVAWKASPPSTAGSRATRAGTGSIAPKTAAITANTPRVKARWIAPQTRMPLMRSATVIGVAMTASNTLRHLIPAMIGQAPSPKPVCMAVAARSPVATKVRKGIGSWASPVPRSTMEPRANPIPARKRTGLRKVEMIRPRQVRL